MKVANLDRRNLVDVALSFEALIRHASHDAFSRRRREDGGVQFRPAPPIV